MDKQAVKAEFQTAKQLMEKYELDTAAISSYLAGIDDFHVTSPLVGRFSTGKSALVNALLEKQYLAENTLPETAIPTEITYGEKESVTLVKKNPDSGETEKEEMVSMDTFLTHDFSVTDWSVIRLRLPDSFLKTVPDVKLVDMPGFGTNIALHNKAINEYLPESKAYILTFPARSSVIEEDTLAFLKELKFHNMPVYVLVTKSASVLEEERNQCMENLQKQLEEDVGLRNVPMYFTNAKGRQVDVAGFRKVLEELEKQSGAVFKEESAEKMKQFTGLLKTYLSVALEKMDFSVSELETEKEKRRKHIAVLKEKLEKAKMDFQAQIPLCIQSIESDVRIALEDFAEEFADLAIENRKETANARANAIISSKIDEGMKRTFEANVSNYLQRVSTAVKIDVPEMDVDLNSTAVSDMTGLVTADMVKKGLVGLLAAIGLRIPNPVVMLLSAAIFAVTSGLGKSNQRKELRQSIIRQFRVEYAPQLAGTVTQMVEELVRNEADKVSQSIDTEVDAQIQAEEKALEDLIQKAEEEQTEREDRKRQLQDDLQIVEKLVVSIG